MKEEGKESASAGVSTISDIPDASDSRTANDNSSPPLKKLKTEEGEAARGHNQKDAPNDNSGQSTCGDGTNAYGSSTDDARNENTADTNVVKDPSEAVKEESTASIQTEDCHTASKSSLSSRQMHLPNDGGANANSGCVQKTVSDKDDNRSTTIDGTTIDGTCSDKVEAENAAEDNVKEEDSSKPLPEDEEYDAQFAFCCQNCSCPWEKQATFYDWDNNRVMCLACDNSGDSNSMGNAFLLHKTCCHKIRAIYQPDKPRTWRTPMQLAIDDSVDGKAKSIKVVPNVKKTIINKYKNAKREENKIENYVGDVAADSIIGTCRVYGKMCVEFQRREKTNAWRVLDLFGGIGSGIVALKKLGLPITKVVHCEHDPVATYVCQHNHKLKDDGIEHVHINEFEEIWDCGATEDKSDARRTGNVDTAEDGGKDGDEKNNEEADKIARKNGKLQKFLEKHGPFNLLMAAAPCTDWSSINAYRKGSEGNSGKYLMEVGHLIAALNKMQEKVFNITEKIIFLSENVTFGGTEKEKRYHELLAETYEIRPLPIDAAFLSPCKRHRFYWFNLQINAIPDIDSDNYQFSCASDMLDEPSSIMPQTICEDEEATKVVKANTFLAAQGRIDDKRMLRVEKVDDNHYVGNTLSVSERERMLGLPDGYVAEPLKKLFGEITMKGFLKPETTVGLGWKDDLDKSLWHFSKKCKFKIEKFKDVPFFKIKISSPLETKKDLYYFDEQEYCKHLLGNGWSIPVIEHVLKKLKDKSRNTQVYDGYEYDFPWPPYSIKRVMEPLTETESSL